MHDDTQPHEGPHQERYRRTRQSRPPDFYQEPTQVSQPVYDEYPHHPPVEAQRGRRGRRRARPSWPRMLRTAVVGVMAALAAIGILSVLTALGGYAYFQVFEMIIPGVYVGQVPLGGLTRSEAAQALQETWNESERGLIISDGEQNWYAPASDFGMSLDPTATAQRAYDVGHGAPIVPEMITLFESATQDTLIEPVVSFDEAQARLGLETWASTLTKLPKDASLQIADGKVIAVPGEQGYVLNIEATLQVIAADPGMAVMDGYLPLVLEPIAPRIADASAALEEAERLLASPITIRAYDPVADETMDWTAAPEVIAGWLTVETQEDGPHAVVDSRRLEVYLQDLNTSLGGERYLDPDTAAAEITSALREGRAATLMVRHHETSYTVQYGDTLTRIAWDVGIPYWRIIEANPSINPDALTVGQALTIPSKDDLLPLPVIMGKRIVVDISDQHLWAYENGSEVYSFVISTGIDRSPTQPGIFQVQDHDLSVYAEQWDLTMPHFVSIYEAWPGFFNGFHGLPTLSSGQILWREVLGRPASYGCIILDLDDGETLYYWAEDGVVVEIRE